jgi:hypothetical protein
MWTCKDCRFWEPSGRTSWTYSSLEVSQEKPLGYCHAHPPTVIPFATEFGSKGWMRFPETAQDNWCGEFNGTGEVRNRQTVEKGKDQ